MCLFSNDFVGALWTRSIMRKMFAGRVQKLSLTFNGMSCVAVLRTGATLNSGAHAEKAHNDDSDDNGSGVTHNHQPRHWNPFTAQVKKNKL